MGNKEEVKMSWVLSFLGVAMIFGFVCGLLVLWNKEKPKNKNGWKGDDCQ